MTNIYKTWLEKAYNEQNPTQFLYKFLLRLKEPLDHDTINTLIGQICISPSPISDIRDTTHPMHGVIQDIESFRKTTHNHDALIGLFCYFATSLIHIFLHTNGKMLAEQPILPYIIPNKPLPYIWFNISNQLDVKIELIQHTLPQEQNPVNVITHVVHSPGAMTTVKLAFDLNTKDYSQAQHGNFIQLAILLYNQRFYLQSPCKSMQSIIILTFEGGIHGIYYNDGNANLAHSCVYAAHYV